MNLKVFSLIILASVASAIAQNNQGGTLVTAPIRPFAVQDTFPTAFANEIKGGPFTSTNLTGLSNIPTSRLEIGSLGYAQNTGLFHRLTSISPVTWSPIDGSNFTNIPSTAFSGTLAISNGGTGANSVSTARTGLGATTVGANIFTLANPSAIRFLRLNADNTATTLSDSDFRTAIGLGTAATNPATAFQPSSSVLTNLAANNGSSLTNIPVAGVVGALATNGSAAGLTNFPTVALASNVTGTIAISNGGSGATTAGGARTNLGLGTTNNVEFRTVKINLPDASGNSLVVTNAVGSAVSLFDDIEAEELDASQGAFGNTVIISSDGISFNTNTAAAATTRTNLGLGATWLTNSTAPLFWASVPASPTNSGTAGQIAYTNNFLYICISNNTWRRAQLGTW